MGEYTKDEARFINNVNRMDRLEDEREIWRCRVIDRDDGGEKKETRQCAVEVYLREYKDPNREKPNDVKEGKLDYTYRVYLNFCPSECASVCNVELTDFTFVMEQPTRDRPLKKCRKNKKNMQKMFFKMLPILYKRNQIRLADSFEFNQFVPRVVGLVAESDFAKRFGLVKSKDSLNLVMYCP
jgi:hypothetical protein